MARIAETKLYDYVGENEDNKKLFSEQGIILQIAFDREIEQRGLLAMIAACKPICQNKFGKQMMGDVFRQGLNLVQDSNTQIALLVLLQLDERFSASGYGLQIQNLICENQGAMMEKDDDLQKLMQSILHIWKPGKEQNPTE